MADDNHQEIYEEIRTVLFNKWDPIGVGPMSRALKLGIMDEYDDLIKELLVIDPFIAVGKYLPAMVAYRTQLELPAPHDEFKTSQQIEMILKRARQAGRKPGDKSALSP